ncbi:MAG: hypothetical protein PVI06_04175 [Desulfobacterales bacterium]
MAKVPYKRGDLFSINVLLWCDTLECHTAFMACPNCRHYPCGHLTDQDIDMLRKSPLMQAVSVSLFVRRIKKMYIAKKNDGKLEVIRNLDEKKPDPNQLRNVEEIYVVGKVLIPVLSLKPKSKKERDQIVKGHGAHRHGAENDAANKVSELRRKKN